MAAMSGSLFDLALVVPFLASFLVAGSVDQNRSMGKARVSGSPIIAVGCLKREADVPGRQESATERLGVGRDFVLTDVRISEAPRTSSGGAATQTTLPSGITQAGKSSEARYHVTGLGASTLGAYVNQRVAIEGRLDDDRVGVTRGPQDDATQGKAPADRFEPTGKSGSPNDSNLEKGKGTKGAVRSAAGPASYELPKIRAASIRGVARTCPK